MALFEHIRGESKSGLDESSILVRLLDFRVTYLCLYAVRSRAMRKYVHTG